MILQKAIYRSLPFSNPPGFSLILVFFWISLAACTPNTRHEKATPITTDPIDVQWPSNYAFNCFVYHRFGDSRYPSTNISIEAFAQHLAFLKSQNYRVVTLGEALRLDANDTTHRRTVVITIDDAYTSFLDGAMPLLRKYGYKATLFVNSKTVGGASYLSWAQLKKLVEEGIEIGNHTHSHEQFMNRPIAQRAAAFRNDVLQCQKAIEERLGIKPTLFAYPYGEHGPLLRKVIKELGFKAAVAQNSGVANALDNRYALPRFPMGGNFASLAAFKEKATMHALPVREASPMGPVVNGDPPPSLKLAIDTGQVDLSRAQCFAQGGLQCGLSIEYTDSGAFIFLSANGKLRQRRTLYTLTAPGFKPGTWYWYSHLWLRPIVSE